jgi:hypothetical protein
MLGSVVEHMAPLAEGGEVGLTSGCLGSFSHARSANSHKMQYGAARPTHCPYGPRPLQSEEVSARLPPQAAHRSRRAAFQTDVELTGF